MTVESFERMFGKKETRVSSHESGPLNQISLNLSRTEDSSQLRVSPRDTLYVSSLGVHAPGNDSEWIVSYSSGAKASEARPTPKMLNSEKQLEIDDVYFVVQPDLFNIARIVVGRLLSERGESRTVRLFCSSDQLESVHKAVACILMVSNVMKLRCYVLKKSEEAADLIFVVKVSKGDLSAPSCLSKSAAILNLSESGLENASELASRLFTLLYRDGSGPLSLEINQDQHLELLLRAASVITFEALLPQFESVPPVLQLEMQPSGGGTHIHITAILSSESSNELSRIIKTVPDFVKFGEFITRINGLEGASVFLQYSDLEIDVEIVATSVLRLFMAGYCCVELEGQWGREPLVMTELVLLVVKYFQVTVDMMDQRRLRMTRKSTTVDQKSSKPVRSGSVAGAASLFEEGDEMNDEKVVISTVLLALETGPVSVSMARSVSAIHELLVFAQEAGEMRFHFFPAASRDKVVVRIVPQGKVKEVQSILAKLESVNNSSPRGDVSPSNYRPVDAAVRYGLESEVEDLKEKLDSVFCDSAVGGRISVLLVGPKNIGLGVRLLCREKGVASFEFVSERAVRDGQGAALKCAVRLFIKKNHEEFPKLEDLLSNSFPCETVNVSETDSRITIANKLFTLLNEAPNGYVLIRAETDYCGFIAAMSVVVANGWSRSIHQRVETKVALFSSDQEVQVLYYITRLIVNTV